MKDYLSRSQFINRTIDAVNSHFSVRSMELEEAERLCDMEFSPSSRLLEKQELEEALLESQPENPILQSL